MIAFLEGPVADKAGDRVVLQAGGIGYEVLVPTRTLAAMPPAGRQARLFTRLQVRDDAMVLYGFGSPEERGMFDVLVTVAGVGPKVALAVLSVLAPDALRRAVASGDTAALTVVPGVGKKVAARIVLDLRDRFGVGEEAPTGPLSEVREALLALGLSQQEASDAIAAIGPNGERPVEDLLREALQAVGR